MTETVDALLANPDFDVEHFIHNVNLHESRPIMSTLIADPAIRLAIAEGDDWQVLTRHPGLAKDFINMAAALELEAWKKENTSNYNNNIWYGIVAHDELALGYRHVGRECDVQVWKGKDAAKNARSNGRPTYPRPMTPIRMLSRSNAIEIALFASCGDFHIEFHAMPAQIDPA